VPPPRFRALGGLQEEPRDLRWPQPLRPASHEGSRFPLPCFREASPVAPSVASCYATAPRRRCMKERIAVIGLGYVGLPVAIALARKFPETIGFDISPERIRALREGRDAT